MRHLLSLSVITPAFNEEANIKEALRTIVSSIPKFVSKYEIIVVDDGSSDKTSQVVKNLTAHFKQIKLIRNKVNRGFGHAFRTGLNTAKYDYVTLYPSDNEMSGQSLTDLITHAPDADMIITYYANAHLRSTTRRYISNLYAIIVNLLFGLNVRYHNGPFICKRSLLLSVPLTSDGIAFLTESKVRLIKAGVSYKEIPFSFRQRKFGKSTALTYKNIKQITTTIAILIRDIYLRRAANKKIHTQT
jgi:glycosyltransferase involved in cell wall biosynthesis